MTHVARKSRFSGIVLLLSVVGGAALHGQDPRDALVAQALNEFDATRRLHLLMNALNPAAGPPRGSWPVGVQLLAQTLVEDGQDSLAAVWLRWAIRLWPDLKPDTVQFLPRVIAAYRSARDFVNQTRSQTDAFVTTTWLWPTQDVGEPTSRMQVAVTELTVPVRVQVKGIGSVDAGGSIPLAAGSYEISASAVGYDSARVTREVLPRVTTVLEVHLRPGGARVTVASPAPKPGAQPQKKKRFPAALAVLSASGAVGLLALVMGGGGGSTPAAMGSITVTFPNP